MIQQVKGDDGAPVRETRECPKCGQSFTVTKCEALPGATEDYVRWITAHPWFPKGCGRCERAELRRQANVGREGMYYTPGWGYHRDTGQLVRCVGPDGKLWTPPANSNKHPNTQERDRGEYF